MWLAGSVREILGVELGFDSPLSEAGFDSLIAVEFSQAVAKAFAVRLPATLVYDYPTLNAVASFIAAQAPRQSPDQVY